MALAATVIDVGRQLDRRRSATMIWTVARYVLEPFMADAIVARP